MAHLRSSFVFFLAVASRAAGSKLLAVRRSIDSRDMRSRLEEPSVAPNLADNRSIALKSDKARGHPDASASGSLTCMRWTGGTCRYLGCSSERGQGAVCEASYCMCRSGSCADAQGKCVPNSQGDWIGEYSIRFNKPFVPSKPYLGIDDGGGAGRWFGVTGGIEWLAAVSRDDRQWKIAQTPNGRVRMENTKHPGSVLAIYNNRRRSDFMQRQSQRQRNSTRKMSDDDDLWPVLMKREAATPAEATFQIRHTARNGGGYELWDPIEQVSIASADPDTYGDSVVGKGVTECKRESVWTSDPCEGGKQLIGFEPTLPSKVQLNVAHAHIIAISILTWWQVGLIITCCVCTVVCCQSDENDPSSRPLIGHVVNSAQQAMGAREAQANAAKEAFAERIAGLWVLESDAGTFEYEFQKTLCHRMDVHGRAQGSSQWDTKFVGSLTAVNSADVGTLCWEDNDGTKFSLTFQDSTCSGKAKSGRQEVSLTGKRQEAGS